MSTSHVQMVKLLCDGAGCNAVYENIASHASAVRALAAAEGWRHRREPCSAANWLRAVDLCPACPDDAALVPPRSERRRR